MSGHVVTSPLVNLRVKDAAGTYVLHGFYEGVTLPDDVHPDDVEKHVRKNMIAEKGSPEADAASPVGRRVQFDENGMPMSPAAVAEAAKKTAERAKAEPKPDQRAADQRAVKPAAGRS